MKKNVLPLLALLLLSCSTRHAPRQESLPPSATTTPAAPASPPPATPSAFVHSPAAAGLPKGTSPTDYGPYPTDYDGIVRSYITMKLLQMRKEGEVFFIGEPSKGTAVAPAFAQGPDRERLTEHGYWVRAGVRFKEGGEKYYSLFIRGQSVQGESW